MANETKPESDPEPDAGGFPAYRAAVISFALVGFIMIFRPFGARLDSLLSFVIVAGLAPLNFLAMLAVHHAPFPRGAVRAALSVGAIALANAVYISLWDADAGVVDTTVKVALVSALVFSGVFVWNRQRSLREEIIALKTAPSAADADADVEPFTIRSEDDKEILRLSVQDLFFVQASGNYVEVHYRKAGEPATALLRSTLARTLEQTRGARPDGVLRQCHRSYLVNLAAAVRAVKSAKSMQLEFPDGSRAPVSRRFRAEIIEAIKAR